MQSQSAPLMADKPPSASTGIPSEPSLSGPVLQIARDLIELHGAEHRSRIQKGIAQMALFWRTEDGDITAFEHFVYRNYLADPASRDELFCRLEFIVEQIDGRMHQLTRELRRQTDLDIGPILPVDEMLAGYNPAAHLNEDLFANKIAFVVLLNFPLYSLEEKVQLGPTWTRKQWAEARLADRFSKRIPAEVMLGISQAAAIADLYVAEYNIWMHHVLDEAGQRLFPPQLRLISHWNLRDEIKALYSDPGATHRQQLIADVMVRIVTQTIPQVVINNPHVDWKPVSNQVMPTTSRDTSDPVPESLRITNAREPDTRYEKMLLTFHAAQKMDPHSPTNPSLISRRFNEHREIPEARVRAMFEQLFFSPAMKEVAELITERLGRPLQPFDIWYNGFKARAESNEEKLDRLVRSKYPDLGSFSEDTTYLLHQLGFTREKAEFLAANIVVDPARGAGHAMGGAMREDRAHLRTRFGSEGMNYKGFNVAIHELGHNVEQTFSLKSIDHTLLQGVPNTAFTEAIAFVFQSRDLELLGIPGPGPMARALHTLNEYWATIEIAGAAMVDMDLWHWMYQNPSASPAELREAAVQISKTIWNRYFASAMGHEDVVLLGIYSHMIDAFLYLPDYPIGHMIAFQIDDHIHKSGNFGTEVERMTRLGTLTPDYWMLQATGEHVGPEALLRATLLAVKKVRSGSHHS